MKKYILLGAFLLSIPSAFAQEYEFQSVIDLACTPVENQGNTGTCWSYSSSSFLESEIYRIKGHYIDLSEMYSVRFTYPKKAFNYIQRQGKAQFSEGGLNHDVLDAIKVGGLVPQSVYTGLLKGNSSHDHEQMVKELTAIVEKNAEKPQPTWKKEFREVLDKYLGERIHQFEFQGKSYTPQSFLEMTELKLDNYHSYTSFTHEPFYESFILEVPDNFSNGSYYNLPLNEWVDLVDHALEKGYTLALDADVTEVGFSTKKGIAIVPASEMTKEQIGLEIVDELSITQAYRQEQFENHQTQDDHLMHIVGKAKDSKGNLYYKVKNSWGTDSGQQGYIYMSVSYFKLKAIAVMVHKDAVPKNLKKKLHHH